MTVLEVRNLKAYYDKALVLRNINMEVGNGETVAVIGPNGAGKTTLLKAVVGTVHTTGTILFQNEDLSKYKPHQRIRKGISICPEGKKLFPYMTVEENLRLGALSKDCDDQLEFVYNLFPEIKRRRNSLSRLTSGGEQQMTAIGRALMSRPKLLLLDEPSHGIAPVVLMRIRDAIKTIQDGSDMSILLVEQNIRLALELADQVNILIKGEIVDSGPTSNIKGLENYYLGKI
ncbi:MAG: ABC transporter ATP-binding protein [Candidatus Caldarchaeum sp.]|uniref:ABC transporter ATP-binding protein n=1 Tax=Caldiarchaeum subterraneum TaxID=311458 RepID=A0A7C5QCJ4_CALS0